MNTKLVELRLMVINKLNQCVDRKRYKIKYTDEYYLNFIFYILYLSLCVILFKILKSIIIN